MAYFCKFDFLNLFRSIDYDGLFFRTSIVGRIKDIFKTPAGRQVSPSQVEDVLLSEPQGLIEDIIVAGVMPGLSSDSVDDKGLLIARGWIVLSDKGKKFGADVVVKELENWYKERLSNHKWLHGGIEIVDEVRMATRVFFLDIACFYDLRCIDSQVLSGQAVKSSIAEEI